MSNPNKVFASAKARKRRVITVLPAKSRAEADEIAAANRCDGVSVRVSRYRIGPKRDVAGKLVFAFSYQVHVYDRA